ncbi:alpha/beta hydrolase family protein [Klebsiella variicola]|uniref:alpha/beta hydrolase family protein n=1 Tax=Klebsiella variicola TaxID=244366 RepID=UPI0010F8D802|nr:prolyl oligopeptidase family serine peptidase [Klebsiella variicola]
MERNNELMFRLSPLFGSKNKLFLAAYEGEMFEYDLQNKKLFSRQFSFVFVCDMFSLTQEFVDEQYHCFIYIKGQITDFAINGVIENISLNYNKNSCELYLYTDEEIMAVNLSFIKWSILDVRQISTEEVIPPGSIHMDNGAKIDLSRETISYAYLKEDITYNAILSISEAGVLCQIETDFGADAYLASQKNDKFERLDLNGANVCAACYDSTSSQYYFSVVEKGQQQVITLRDTDVQFLCTPDELYGTVTPFIADDQIALYITGSIEGVCIAFPNKPGADHIISNPLTSRKRIYYENNLIKVTSLASEISASLNVLFFHGGPESCEWDSPRLPGLIYELPDEEINFHIINYAGSSGFGKYYRTVADRMTLSLSLHPLIQWINEKLNGSRLILCGGSFGGAMVLELMSRKEQLAVSIAGSVITNPLLDLDFHISRVRQHQEDITFFETKFSEEDRSLISVERLAFSLKESPTKTLFILGRHDEILTIKPALKLLNLLKNNNNIQVSIDDGGHSSLDKFFEREKKMSSFIKKLLLHCETNYDIENNDRISPRSFRSGICTSY